ncbi:MAG: cupredoxin domain-containing protein, partial [Aridibacter sp.]
NGFTPQTISYKANNPLKLAFYRADQENCVDGIVFKDLNIKKDLPVGEVVLVDIPTDKKGEFNYSCSNGKLKGSITIN